MLPTRESMGPRDLLAIAAKRLDDADIRYFVSGSMASSFYGEYRPTHDVDIVLSISPRGVPVLVEAFSTPEFHIEPETARRAVENLDQFNVLVPRHSLKIDFIIVDEDRFDASRFSRRRRIEFAPGQSVWLASPEDVILKKLLYYKEGRSDKHLRDIAGMFLVSNDKIDRQYTEHWAMCLGVSELWRYVIDRVEGREPGPTV